MSFQKRREISALSFTFMVLSAMFGCVSQGPLSADFPRLDRKPKEMRTSPSMPISPIATFEKGFSVYSMTWSSSGRLLAIGGRKKILLWNVAQRKVLRTLSDVSGDVVSLAFSPDGETLASGGYRRVELWHVTSGRKISTLSGQVGYITALAFHPEGQRLAAGSGGDESGIDIWDIIQKRIDIRLTYSSRYADRIGALAFSPEGDQLAAVGLDRRIRIWKIKKGVSAQEPDQSFFDPIMTPRTMAFSPDQKVLAVGTAEGQITLFDLLDRKILKRLNRHQGGLTSLAFRPNGKVLVSSGKDRVIRHWNIDTGRMVKAEQFDSVSETAAISNDGRFLASQGVSGTVIYSLTDNRGIPPVIAILTPMEAETVDQSPVRLSGKIVDDQGVAEVVIRINDVIWEGIHRAGTRDLKIKKKRQQRQPLRREIFLDASLPLRAGKNKITITAYDLEGLAREETVNVTYSPDKGEIWAAVIGISQYQHVEALKYADADARAFYHYLIVDNEIPEDHVTLLLNEEATLQRLRDLLGVELKEKARKKDTVIIYYAGHGAPEPDRSSLDGDGLEKYLLPYDADPRRLFSTALPMAEISKIFSRISAERIVMLQDTCFSGSSIGGRTIQTAMMRAPLSEGFLDRMTQGKGRVIITASEANEVSLERDDLGHGVFTFYLLEALQKGDRDGDGLITTTEVFRYVSEKVPQATGQNQHPVKKGIETSEIVLGRVRPVE